MGQLLFGTTVLTAIVAGMVALLAPCCISVMLPAFFANSFRRRRALVSMTAVFALGVATVILPVDKGLARRLPSATRPYFYEPTMSEVDLDAQRMVKLLSSSPDRAAVVSRLLDLLCEEERNVLRNAIAEHPAAEPAAHGRRCDDLA